MTADAEARALAMRERLGLGATAPVGDIIELVEVGAELPVVVANLGQNGVAGAYLLRRSQGFILVNGAAPFARARFTIAHELGHHALGHGQVVDGVIEQAPGSAAELQANSFAAEFLVPRAGVDAWLRTHDRADPRTLETVVRLAHHFGASSSAVRFRLEACRRLTSRKDIRDLDAAIEAGRDWDLWRRLALPNRVETLSSARHLKVRLPARTEELFLRAVSAQVLDPKRAATELGISEAELRRRMRLSQEPQV